MKNKIFFSLLFAAAAVSMASCDDFLETESPSVTDRETVFSDEESAQSALLNAYETLRQNQSLHSVGFFWTPVWGSDIEDAQDTYNDGSPGCQEKTFYPGGTENYNINSGERTEVFGNCYKTIAICNSLIECFESLSNFSEIMTGEPNSLSNIYGQAVALRATMYYELIKWYGDVPHALKAGESAKGLTSRYAIYDYHLEKLMEVEPHMYRPGENGTRADVMNRSYVQGLIARIALYDGGYSTRRTDLGADFYVDGAGKVLTFDDWSVEKNHAIYGRRSDWKTVFEKAIPYLRSFMNDHGSIVLYTVDPRGKGPNGQEFDCPYQYTFEQMHSDDGYTVADEAVYEIPFQIKGGAQRPAYIGRPSSGGNGQAPCIACGQDRIQAHFYYGWFDPQDQRRDVSCSVTGSTGQGTELMQSFNRSAWGAGCGPGTNKWDWNRYAAPDTRAYGNSSMNVSYMRISDVYLMLAELLAATGNDAEAKNYLATVHNRAFRGGVDPNFEKYIADAGSVYDAVIKERALEFSGEGVRRFDLIRTGKLPKACVDDRAVMTKILDDVRDYGYHTFENGNQIPAYIWTKMVDARAEYGYRLTTQCPVGKEDDPVLYPSWRGQHNDWGSLYPAFAGVTQTNVAIKGLFKYIEPGSEEAKALEADGYVQTNWACDMEAYRESYATKLLAGYSDADYAAKNPPIHFLPYIYSVVLNSGVTNGYGFRQE